MIIICQDCGKKYRLDTTKLHGESARFKCKACDRLIQLTIPTHADDHTGNGAINSINHQSTVGNDTNPDRIERKGIWRDHGATSNDDSDAEISERSGVYTASFGKDDEDVLERDFSLPQEPFAASAAHSLRSKMMILFFALPIVLFSVSSAFFLFQMKRLEKSLTDESVRIVNRLAEEKIADLSRAVANQCKLYLLTKPSLKKEKFIKDSKFQKLAIQKVGATGYTALYERPGKDGIWRTWSHVQPKIIGIDMSTLKEPLGQNFDGFWRVFTGVSGGEESKGYYTWKDGENRIRKKFMVCTPIEGTNYVIAATTYLEELTQSVTELKSRSHILARRIVTIIAISLVATLLLIGAIVLMYSFRLTRRIRSLTEVADRISIGDMDAVISVQSKDEIGELAEAITRMQESIRLSIQRLRSSH
jgi:HAMP domain-containing protein